MCKCVTCCGAQVAKCVLGFVNSIIITIGVLLAILGCILHFGGNFLYQLISDALAKLTSSSAGSSVRSALSVQDLETIMGSWIVYISYAGIALLAIGLFLVATGLIGAIGACCNSKILIIVYIIIMAILALGCVGLAVGYIVNKSQVRATGSTQMQNLVKQQYQGRASANDFTNILDLVQARVPCCGVENYTDFATATEGGKWNNTYMMKNGTYINLVHPLSCCKTSSATLEPTNETCTYAPDMYNSNFMAGGCYAKLWDAFDAYSASATYGLFIAAAVTGIIAGLAVIIVINIEKD